MAGHPSVGKRCWYYNLLAGLAPRGGFGARARAGAGIRPLGSLARGFGAPSPFVRGLALPRPGRRPRPRRWFNSTLNHPADVERRARGEWFNLEPTADPWTPPHPSAGMVQP